MIMLSSFFKMPSSFTMIPEDLDRCILYQTLSIIFYSINSGQNHCQKTLMASTFLKGCEKLTLQLRSHIINQSSSTSTSEKSDDIKNSIEQSIIKKIDKKKVYLKEATEINLDKTAEEENEKPKKKGFFKKLKNKFSNSNN